MKKSLVALAVLAASGASFAQSAVTVYGIADVWFGSEKNEVGAVSTTQTKIDAGGVSGNRWGLKGSEDLGGGLKANFNLEQGFSMDNGAAGAAGSAFSRQSWVGFSGGFGEVRLGRTTTPYDDVSGASDAVFDSALSPMNWVMPSVLLYTARPNNTIYYQAPDFSGFSGAISYSLGENKTATTDATSTTSLNLTYGAGPLAVQLGYQLEELLGSADQKFLRLGASYDLGVAKLMATYGKVSNAAGFAGADATDWQLGLDYPVSAALTVSASAARSTGNATAGDYTATGYGIGASYNLSKRTSVYGGYESDKTTAPAIPDIKHRLLAVGVRHAF